MEEIDIKDFLNYLKKYALVALIVAVIAAAGTAVYDLGIKQKLYRSYTTVVLAQDNTKAESATTTTLNDININQKLVSTYSEIVKSKRVLQEAIDKLELDTTPEKLAKQINVTAIEDTEIIKIAVSDPDAERAAAIANKVAEIFATTVHDTFGLNNATILDEAEANNIQSNNTTLRDLAIALLLSVFGVVAVAFVIYYFDDSVKYSEELESQVKMPIAGKVVKSEIKLKPGDNEILVENYPKSAVSESIKGLRTNLQFASVDKEYKTILVTSSTPSEGKSFVSANLATSFAQTGKKVLLVDCDLRKGRVHKMFNLPNTLGLSFLLTESADKYKKYVQKTSIKNLSVITRGAFPPNPSELLGSQKNKDLIAKLKDNFDIIIFDGAPCNSVTDSVIMATIAEEVLVVARDGFTPRSALEATRESLSKINAPVAGLVINAVNKNSAKYYSYYGEK